MKRYLLILNLLLTGIVFFIGVNIINALISEEQQDVSVSYQKLKKTVLQETGKPRPLSFYKMIHEHNLFSKKSPEPNNQKQLEIDTLKKTDLKLKLWGTVIGNDGETYAVVESTGGKQYLFRVGDSVQNAVIKMILRGKVVLTVDDKDEILEMEKMLTSKAGRHYPTVKETAPQQNIPIERSHIETAAQNVNQMMQEIKIRPHFEQGRLDGISIIGIKPNSIFRKMGLVSGDILTSIDGNRIESVEDAMRFFENLNSTATAKLEIKRRGKIQTIQYNIE